MSRREVIKAGIGATAALHVRVHETGDDRGIAEVFVRGARAVRFDGFDAVAAHGDSTVRQRRAADGEHPARGVGS